MASFSYDGDWQAWFWRGNDSAASPGMEGGRNNPPESFSSPSWSIGVQIQSKLANDFWPKKKQKESYPKYDLVSPTPQEGIKAKHHDQSWASEWMRREPLCWQALLHQAGWGLHHLPPPQHFKWSCCIPQFPENLLLVLQMCWPPFSLIVGDMLSRKSAVIIVELALE